MEQEFQQQSLISSIDRVDPFLLSLGELVSLTLVAELAGSGYGVAEREVWSRDDRGHPWLASLWQF